MKPSSNIGRKCTLLAAVVLAGAGLVEAEAASFPDLYTVTVRPDPEAPDQRREAIRIGMMSLLARVTGRTEAGASPELAELVENAGDYVNSYGFSDRETAQIGFISSAVEQALGAANWPVWGAERPLTLIWMAVDGGNGERGLVSESFDASQWSPEMAELMRSLESDLREAADRRGLPIVLPLLDLEDLDAVSFADVWGGFDERISQASQRYRADAYLLANVRVGPFGPDIRWTLVQGTRRRIVLSSTVGEGMDWLAEQYSAEFSSVGGARTLRITVLDVDSLEDYGRVMSYLESLSLLDDVDIESFDGTELNLRVAARGDETVLQRVLALGGVLAPPTARPAFLQTPSSLRFELVQSGLNR